MYITLAEMLVILQIIEMAGNQDWVPLEQMSTELEGLYMKLMERLDGYNVNIQKE